MLKILFLSSVVKFLFFRSCWFVWFVVKFFPLIPLRVLCVLASPREILRRINPSSTSVKLRVLRGKKSPPTTYSTGLRQFQDKSSRPCLFHRGVESAVQGNESCSLMGHEGLAVFCDCR